MKAYEIFYHFPSFVPNSATSIVLRLSQRATAYAIERHERILKQGCAFEYRFSVVTLLCSDSIAHFYSYVYYMM